MSNPILGRSLELYFIDGKPDGMLTAEVFNWTGHALVTPRTQLSEALGRKEANYTGIYLLLGENDGTALAYIGEGEDIGERIRSHDSKKEWWTKAVLVTTGANNLNKAHVKYLEARLIEDAIEVGRMLLENNTRPTRPGLSESAQANMEGFLDYLYLVLPAIGIDMFVRRTRPSHQENPIPTKAYSEVFEIGLRKEGITATAQLIEGEFVVLAGSSARKVWQAPNHNYRRLFEELVQAGILVEEGQVRKFAENYAFSSPSAAGAMVVGRACNGQTAWTVKSTGETYREWEQKRLEGRG